MAIEGKKAVMILYNLDVAPLGNSSNHFSVPLSGTWQRMDQAHVKWSNATIQVIRDFRGTESLFCCSSLDLDICCHAAAQLVVSSICFSKLFCYLDPLPW
jgi:hypothetical protein